MAYLANLLPRYRSYRELAGNPERFFQMHGVEGRRMLQPYFWRHQYSEALLETHPLRQIALIAAALGAISSRIEELRGNHDGTIEEKQAIADALWNLQTRVREIDWCDVIPKAA